MADIAVSLELDDSKFTNKLALADKNVKLFGTDMLNSFKNGQLQLTRLGESTEGINKRFEGLTRAIVGIGILEFGRSLLESAERLKDMAESVDISVARMMEMSVAAVTANSSLEGVTKMINKLEVGAQQAADGNTTLRKAFQDVGVSFDDLKNKSPDQVFNQIAVAIGRIEDPAKRAQVATELFGRGARGFDFKQYSENIQRTYGTMDAFAESQRRAAEISEQLKLKMELIKGAFLETIDPILKLVVGTGDATEQMAQAKLVAEGLAAALAIFAANAAVNAVRSLATAFVGVASALGLSTAATTAETAATAANTLAQTANATARATGLAAKVASLETSLAQAQAEIATAGAMGASAGVVSAANRATWLLVSARANLAEATAGATASTAAFTASEIGATGATAGLTAASTGLMARLGAIGAIAATVGIAIAAMWPKDANAGEAEEVERIHKIQDAVTAMSDAERKRYFDLSDAERKRVNDLIVSQNEMRKTAEIMDKITGANGKGTGNTLVGPVKDLGAEYRLRVQEIQQQTEQINKQNEKSLDRLKLEGSLATQSQRVRDAELTKFDAQVKYSDEIYKIDTEILKIRQQIAQLSPADLETGKGAGLESVIRAYEQQKRQIKDVGTELATQRLAQAEYQRTFDFGWQKAFNDYADNATNAAKVAENIFATATKGMEDAIVTFAKTGKFEWQNLLQTMVEELLRSQIRQTMASVLGLGSAGAAGGSGGGIFAGIGKLFGFAEGGPVTGNTPILVGERGPEIFTPPGNGNIIPNKALGGGGAVTYNINAVDAASFKALVAKDPQFIYAVTEMGRRTLPA